MSQESAGHPSVLEKTDGPVEGLSGEEQSRQEPARTRSPWLAAAVVLSTVAGLIHLAVAPEHFQEWIGYGVFFTVVGIGSRPMPPSWRTGRINECYPQDS